MGCFDFLFSKQNDGRSNLSKNRSCTDYFCGVIFLLFLIGMVIMTVFACYECGWNSSEKTFSEGTMNGKPFYSCTRDILKKLGRNAIDVMLYKYKTSIDQIMTDLYNADFDFSTRCTEILFVCVSGFLTMYLIRVQVSLIIYATYSIFIGIVAAVTGSYWYAYALRNDAHEEILKLSVFSTVFLVMLLLVTFVMWKRVAFGIELCKQVSQVLVVMPSLFYLSLMCVVCAHLLVICVNILIEILVDVPFTEELLSDIAYDDKNFRTDYVMTYLSGLIFIINFTFCCVRFVVASSVAEWYFTRNKKIFYSKVCQNIVYLIRYHIGSVAFGAFIVTLPRLPIKQWTGYEVMEGRFEKNLISTWLMNLVTHVITVVAIQRKNFCISAKKVILMLVWNFLRVFAVVGIIIVVSTYVLVMVGWNAFDQAVMLKAMYNLEMDSSHFITFFKFSFGIASLFFFIYEGIVFSIFYCFCEDVRMNNGSRENPYFMEESLIKFVNNSSKTGDDENKQLPALTEDLFSRNKRQFWNTAEIEPIIQELEGRLLPPPTLPIGTRKMETSDFLEMLVNLSKEINMEDVEMLRFLYTNHANVKADFEEAKSAFDLFEQLKKADHLKPTDITILFETIELTGWKYLQEIIKNYTPFPDNVKITRFSPHHQYLFRFAKGLSTDDIRRLCCQYGVPVNYSSNQWKLFQYLHNNKHVSENNVSLFRGNLSKMDICVGELYDHGDFNAMLDELSNAINENDVEMLRCLYNDTVSDQSLLDKAKSAFDLFKLLEAPGKLAQTDISILYETIEITGLRHLHDIITKYKEHDTSKSGTWFSRFRCEVINLGKSLSTKDLQQIIDVHDVDFVSQWQLIRHLENSGALTKTNMSLLLIKVNEVNTDFNKLLLDISDAIKQEDTDCKYVDMLKFLYTDIKIDKIKLENANSAFDLFDFLREKDNLKPKEISILFETIEITGLRFLQKILEKHGKYTNEVNITQFSLRCQIVFGLAKQLSTQDITRICRLYQVPEHHQDNKWKVLQYLQEKDYLSEDKKEQFLLDLQHRRTNPWVLLKEVLKNRPIFGCLVLAVIFSFIIGIIHLCGGIATFRESFIRTRAIIVMCNFYDMWWWLR